MNVNEKDRPGEGPPPGYRVARRARGAVAMAAGILVAVPAPGAAQELALEPMAGLTVPVAAFADLADAGPMASLGAALRVHPRFSLRVDLAVDGLSAAGLAEGEGGVAGFPPSGELRVWRYTAGLEADALVPGLTPLTLVVDGGLGGASVRPAEESTPQTPSGRYLLAQAGVKVGWDLSRRWNLFAALKGSAVFAGDDADSDGLLAGSGTLWSLPLSAGVRVRFY